MSENLKQLFINTETGKIIAVTPRSNDPIFHAVVIDDPLREKFRFDTDLAGEKEVSILYTDNTRTEIAEFSVTNNKGEVCGPVTIADADNLSVVAWDDEYHERVEAEYELTADGSVFVNEIEDGTYEKSEGATSDKLTISTSRLQIGITVHYKDSSKAAIDHIDYDNSQAEISGFDISDEVFEFSMKHESYKAPKVATYNVCRSSSVVTEVGGGDEGEAKFRACPVVSECDLDYETAGNLLEKEIFPQIVATYGETKIRTLYVGSGVGESSFVEHVFVSAEISAKLTPDGWSL